MQLINCFPSWMTGGGIFAKMTGVPWDESGETFKTALDLEYFGNRSGHRETSPLLDKMICLDDSTVLTDAEVGRLANIAKTLYLENWQRLWTLYGLEYNPIENYNRDETETNNDTETNKHDVDTTETDKEKTDRTREIKQAVKVSNTDEVYSMGASAASPAAKSTQEGAENDNRQTIHDTGTDSANVRTITRNADGSLNKDTLTRDNSRHTVAKGNIGVTTTQAMFTQELELRKVKYFDAIFADMDKLLTLPVWRLCYEP